VGAVFALGFTAGILWPHKQVETMYGWRVQRVLPPDSLAVTSPATGPFRADFCPDSKIMNYLPKAGYAMCRIQFVDVGCIKPKAFEWVKNNDANQSTATLGDGDTFRPYPDCHKDDLLGEN
jgi:hypothetical protein